jgi:integrase
VAVLTAHRERMVGRARKAAVVPAADGYVFSPALDLRAPWVPDHFTDAWRRLRAKAEVSGRLHDLRHFAATMLIAAGVPIRTVSGRLGHAQTSTTLNIYAGFVEATDQAAAEVLGQLLSPDAKEPPALEAGGSDGDDEDGPAGVPARV